MIQNELNIRLKPAIESPSSDKIPLDGEIVLVKDTSNSANNNIRIGNGSNAISSLSNFLTLGGGTGTDEKVKQTNTTSNSTYPLLFTYATSPTSGNADEARYNTGVTLNPSSSLITHVSGNVRVAFGAATDMPIQYQTRANSSSSWTNIHNRIVTSRGLIAAPTGNNGDEKYLKATIGTDNAVTWSWTTLSSGTAYSTTLNGTSLPTSGSTSLGSWYAPITSGTSGNMLKSNGSGNAPTWDSLENIIGKKTANYVLAGNGTASGNGVVSWQQLSLSSLSDAPNTGTLTLNGTGFSVYSPTASLSKTWYAPESAGTATNLFLKWDTTNSKPIWTTLSNILGSTSGNLLLGDGSTLTKAITTTKINGTSYTALSDTGSAQTQTNNIYAPTDAGSQYNLLVSNGSGAPSWFAQGSNTGLLKFTSGSGWSIDTNSYIPSPTNDNGFLYNNGLGVWSIHHMTYRGISVGGTTILADSVNTYLNLVAGNNITITPEQSGTQYTGKITINATGSSSGNPTHLDVWIGHTTSANSIITMDAPFFCTDLSSPDYDDGSRFFAFPGLSCQWGVYGTSVVIPEHITLWPNGTHAMNKTSTGCDNWMAVMMTSWGAGHPMSLSYVRRGVRKWMPLVYVGPLNVGTAQAPVIRSVAIDLGAAIMIHLINNGLVSASTFPFATVEDRPYLWSLTQNFTSNFSIGTSPITFRYFSGTHTNNCSNISSMEPSGDSNQLVGWINTGIANILKYSFEFPLSMTGSTLEDEWSKVPGWEDDPRYDSDPGIKDYGIGSGVIFRTWEEIVSDKDYNYEGVLVCTALPEIHAIQHI